MGEAVRREAVSGRDCEEGAVRGRGCKEGGCEWERL